MLVFHVTSHGMGRRCEPPSGRKQFRDAGWSGGSTLMVMGKGTWLVTGVNTGLSLSTRWIPITTGSVSLAETTSCSDNSGRTLLSKACLTRTYALATSTVLAALFLRSHNHASRATVSVFG